MVHHLRGMERRADKKMKKDTGLLTDKGRKARLTFLKYWNLRIKKSKMVVHLAGEESYRC